MPIELIDPSEIPKVARGKKGADWLEYLNANVPIGKTIKVTDSVKIDKTTYKIGSIKAGVTAINKESKKQLFQASQRTLEGKVVLYITRIE